MPRGAAALLPGCTGGETILSGPAGTGKTRGALEHLHALALAHPGSRGLITRHQRKALTQTALVTFNEEVRPDLDGAEWWATRGEYRYPNGSVVVVAGLDQDGKRVFSGQYDHVYVNEATELAESTWENLTTRLRHGKSDRQILFGDCNPDRPTHWIKARERDGPLVLLESRHEDNPRYYDGRDWTAEGRGYLARLDKLTGHRKLRLRWGRWAAAEGVIYEAWDPAIHVLDAALLPGGSIPPGWPRLWAVDFGYTNPFALLFCALDNDRRLYVYRQLYHTRRLVTDHARAALECVRTDPGGWPPAGIIADPEDAEGRATLAAALGIPTVPANKSKGSVRAGIQAVQARLAPAGDGKPRLYVVRGGRYGLIERDPELADAKKPTCLEDEFDSYCWSDRRAEEPVDADNHALDALRYLVAALDAPRAAAETAETVWRA